MSTRLAGAGGPGGVKLSGTLVKSPQIPRKVLRIPRSSCTFPRTSTIFMESLRISKESIQNLGNFLESQGNPPDPKKFCAISPKSRWIAREFSRLEGGSGDPPRTPDMLQNVVFPKDSLWFQECGHAPGSPPQPRPHIVKKFLQPAKKIPLSSPEFLRIPRKSCTFPRTSVFPWGFCGFPRNSLKT